MYIHQINVVNIYVSCYLLPSISETILGMHVMFRRIFDWLVLCYCRDISDRLTDVKLTPSADHSQQKGYCCCCQHVLFIDFIALLLESRCFVIGPVA